MLDQYIINCLKENEQQLMELKEKHKMLQIEEESCQNMIRKLTDRADMGREIFSPRNPGDSTRQKVSDIRKQIDELHLQEVEVEDKMHSLQEEVDKYQKMLVEVKNRDNEKYQIKQLKKNPPVLEEKEEFRNILSRVERCLNLLETDKERCRNELMNLKYYLKALLSEK